MKILLTLLCAVFPLFAEAFSLSPFEPSPFHLAYSGAGSASLKPADFSYLLNPAGMGFNRHSRAAVAYGFKGRRQIGALSLADQKTGFPLAVTFQRMWSSTEKSALLDRMSFSSGAVVIPNFSMGVSVHRDKKKGEGKSRWNGDMGAVLLLGRGAGVGVACSKLLIYDSKNNRVMTFGFFQKWSPAVSGRIDASFSRETRWTARGGLEILLKKFIAVRGGGAWSFEEEKPLFSGGVGLYSPRLQFDYALQKDDTILQHLFIAKLLF